MSGLQIHAEGGLVVLRRGPAGAGAAVVMVLPLDIETGPAVALPAAIAKLATDISTQIGAVYLLGATRWRAPTAMSELRDRVLPRALRRVVRDACLAPDGPLHLVGLGLGGTLLVASLLEAPAFERSDLPSGSIALVATPVDWSRAPLLSRVKRVLMSWGANATAVRQLDWKSFAEAMGGPSRQKTGLASRPRGRRPVSVELLHGLASWSPRLIPSVRPATRRGLLLIHGTQDALVPAALSHPLHRAWNRPGQVEHVSGDNEHLPGLLGTRQAIRRHLARGCA